MGFPYPARPLPSCPAARPPMGCPAAAAQVATPPRPALSRLAQGFFIPIRTLLTGTKTGRVLLPGANRQTVGRPHASAGA